MPFSIKNSGVPFTVKILPHFLYHFCLICFFFFFFTILLSPPLSVYIKLKNSPKRAAACKSEGETAERGWRCTLGQELNTEVAHKDQPKSSVQRCSVVVLALQGSEEYTNAFNAIGLHSDACCGRIQNSQERDTHSTS